MVLHSVGTQGRLHCCTLYCYTSQVLVLHSVGTQGQGSLWCILLHQPGASVTQSGNTGVGHISQCGVVIQCCITQCENNSV